jgi:hypothetical protein
MIDPQAVDEALGDQPEQDPWVAAKTSGSSTLIAISELMSKNRRQFSSAAAGAPVSSR